MPWSYEEALQWLYARQALGIKLGLGKMERLLSALGDPHRAYRVVHVAGTNGKGSVTRMMADALRRSGLKVGCTTSPHLVSFTERIEVDGVAVTRDVVAAGLARIRPPVEALDAEQEPPTFFEVVTALAFLVFRDAGVQWAVVETGMGGRLDATNVVEPDLTIITNVELDHMAHLGSSVAEIAFEKAGIMKPGVPCVTGAAGDAWAVVSARSHELRSPVSRVVAAGEPSTGPRPDYTVVDDEGGLLLVRPNGEAFYEVGLAGAHQRTNAALVVAGVDALRLQGVAIPETAVRAALRHANNPGRLQLVKLSTDDVDSALAPETVEVLVDGAHNPAAGRALRAHLFATQWRGFDLIAGFCADKDWQATVSEWLFPAARLWAVPVRNPRTLDPAKLRDTGKEAGVRSDVSPDFASALRSAVQAGGRRIVVAGSLFLAGEAVAYLGGQTLEEIHGTQ